MTIERRLGRLEATMPPPPAAPRPLTPEERAARVAAILARLPDDPAEWVARAEAGDTRLARLVQILAKAGPYRGREVGHGA